MIHSPQDAIQIHIDATKITIAALQKEGYEDKPELILLAALELALVDAKCAAGVASGKLTIKMTDARETARAKLYEVLR